MHRQISASGEYDEKKASSLDFMLGTSAWRTEFIAVEEGLDLWGENQEVSIKQANVDLVTRFMIRRMKQIFLGVVLDEWLPLGPGGSHWYSLLFACANPSPQASSIAQRVARHIMKRK